VRWTYKLKTPQGNEFTTISGRRFETAGEVVAFIAERRLEDGYTWKGWEFSVIEIVNGKEVRHD